MPSPLWSFDNDEHGQFPFSGYSRQRRPNHPRSRQRVVWPTGKPTRYLGLISLGWVVLVLDTNFDFFGGLV